MNYWLGQCVLDEIREKALLNFVGLSFATFDELWLKDDILKDIEDQNLGLIIVNFEIAQNSNEINWWVKDIKVKYG